MLFASIWSLLVLAYVGLTPIYFVSAFHNLAALILEWITAIFWFAGSIASAANWSSTHCGGDTYCGTSNAVVAFGFFLFALFTFLAVVDTLGLRRARGTATGTGKPYGGV